MLCCCVCSVRSRKLCFNVDFTSLYRAINKVGLYPLGHPEVIVNPSLEKLLRREYFGMVKCVVVPPRGLFHPVLPVRYGGKLLFPLCRSCVSLKTAHCSHEGQDRAFTGTWCTPEIYQALDEGYMVLEVLEVHHFERKRRGLFGDYVNTFLKAKQEASGWPRDDMTEEEKNAYIVDYLAHEGIALDPDTIKANEGMRQTMKIILNSLWGKFGQRGNMTQSKMCMAAKDFYSLIMNDRFDITGLFACPDNDQCLELLYNEKEHSAKEPRNTNVYVACFTTCHARLQLYQVLKQLGERVLYYDTDSVIYRHSIHDDCGVKLGMFFLFSRQALHRITHGKGPLGQRPPRGLCVFYVGAYLGQLTDELSKDHSRHIVEFCSTGPKSYSFRDNEGLVKIKFKGVCKTLHNIELVNFESMVLCVQEGVFQHFDKFGLGVKSIAEVKNLLFKKDRFGHLSTEYLPKVFRMVYDKRWIQARDYVTYPFGYSE